MHGGWRGAECSVYIVTMQLGSGKAILNCYLGSEISRRKANQTLRQ